MTEKDLCFDCREKGGYSRKDEGMHTCQRKKCSKCGLEKLILPNRHWIKND